MPKSVAPKIRTRDFSTIIKRKSFISKNDPPNERRFDQTESVTNNKIQSKSKRIQNVDIGKLSARDESLILGGGVKRRNLSMHKESDGYNLYDDSLKDMVLAKTCLNVIDF